MEVSPKNVQSATQGPREDESSELLRSLLRGKHPKISEKIGTTSFATEIYWGFVFFKLGLRIGEYNAILF